MSDKCEMCNGTKLDQILGGTCTYCDETGKRFGIKPLSAALLDAMTQGVGILQVKHVTLEEFRKDYTAPQDVQPYDLSKAEYFEAVAEMRQQSLRRAWDKIRKLREELAQRDAPVAPQSGAEPVALMGNTTEGAPCTWFSRPADGTMLYAHKDPSELARQLEQERAENERLRGELELEQEAVGGWQETAISLSDKIITLNSLLNDCRWRITNKNTSTDDYKRLDKPVVDRIDAALSASAEPTNKEGEQ